MSPFFPPCLRFHKKFTRRSTASGEAELRGAALGAFLLRRPQKMLPDRLRLHWGISEKTVFIAEAEAPDDDFDYALDDAEMRSPQCSRFGPLLVSMVDSVEECFYVSTPLLASDPQTRVPHHSERTASPSPTRGAFQMLLTVFLYLGAGPYGS